MRFNIKQFNYKRLYIHFCFLALLNIFFSTENIEAKTFSVNDIEISTPFEINFDKNKIIEEGFSQAFDRLILSIVQTKDQKKFGKISLNQIKGMIETFSMKEEKFIKFSIKKMFDLYVLLLQLLVEVQKLAEQKQEISKKKYLATQEDLSPNRKFVENKLIKKIGESTSISLHIEAQHLNNWSKDDEYVKIIWDKLQKSALFSDYLTTEEDSFNVDKSFVIDFFREIVAPNTKLAEYFEDENITWVDDIPFVNTWVLRSLKKQKATSTFSLASLYKHQDDLDFV